MLEPPRKVDIESVLYSYYIRYDRLWEINQYILQPISKVECVDVYIDLYNMLKKIYGIELGSKSNFSITSSIINIAAHIRGYYRTRHKMWTRIFLVYGDESNLNHRQFYQNFNGNVDRTTYGFAHTDNMVQSQLELVKILAAYIPDVYFIRRNSDFTMFTVDNIMNSPETKLNIIITKSTYAYQIPAIIGPKAVIFRPSKYKGEDRSIYVSCSNVFPAYFRKVNRDDVLARFYSYHPSLLSLFIILNGCKDKNVTSLTNINRSSSMVSDAIDHGRMQNKYSGMTDMLYSALVGINVLIDPMGFDYRFKAIDILYQHMVYKNTIESQDYSWKIDLNDPITVRNINNQYFINNPLDLNNLWGGQMMC